MSNVIPFSTIEAMAIAKSHGIIEHQIKAVDAELVKLMQVILEQAEELEDEDVLDVWQMTEAIRMMLDAVCRDPKDYDSFSLVQDWANTLDAFYETGGDDDDL